MSAAKPPFLGFGLGLRPQHYAEILNGSPQVDWFEVLSENYMVEGGQPLRMLDRICERYPVVMHGVSLSIASTSPLDFDYLTRLKALAARVNPKWISDHLCWTGVHGVNLHDLLPIPYTREALDHVVDRVSQVQDFLGRRLTLENVSSYVTFGQSEMTEWEFVSEVANRADCWLLFDVNNVYVSAYNHGFSADDFLNGVPRDRVVQFHVAGHSHEESHIVDTHDHPVCDEVWDVYRAAVAHFGPVSTMIERDDNIPPLAELVDELDHARSIAREVLGARASPPRNEQPQRPSGELPARHPRRRRHDPCRDQGQRQGRAQSAVRRLPPTPMSRASPRCLADDYEQLHAYLGDAGFAKFAKSYIAAHPSDRKSARDFGRHVPEFLESRRRLRQASRACRDRAPGEGAGRCLRWARRRAA